MRWDSLERRIWLYDTAIPRDIPLASHQVEATFHYDNRAFISARFLKTGQSLKLTCRTTVHSFCDILIGPSPWLIVSYRVTNHPPIALKWVDFWLSASLY
jgi:hypothetical protein